MNTIRKERLESRIREIMSSVLTKKIQNFGIGYLTFTKCELNRDSSQVKVFFSIFPNNSEVYEQAFVKLKKMRKFFQYNLSAQLHIKRVPEVFFEKNILLDT